MSGPGLALERARTHVARSLADAPAWAGVLLLLVAPLAAGDMFEDYRSVGLSAGLAVLGAAVLARRMAGPADAASSPEAGFARRARELASRRRVLAACAAVLLCVPAIVMNEADGSADRISLGAPAVAGALCGVFPAAVPVVFVAACGAAVAVRRGFGLGDDVERRGIFIVCGPIGDFNGGFNGGRNVVSDTSRAATDVPRIVAVAALLAATVRGRLLTIACGVLALLGIGSIVALAVRGPSTSFRYQHGHSLLVPADILACAAMAAVAGALSRASPPGDGTPLVALRRHPWISVACVLAGMSLISAGLVNGRGSSRVEDHVLSGVLLVSVAMAAALGGARTGDATARVPAVLGLQPLIAGLLLTSGSGFLGALGGPPLAAAIVALCGGCVAAFVPFRPPIGVIPVACGVLAHFWVIVAVVVQGFVPGSLVVGAIGLPFAVVLTSWDARVATLGTATIWAGAGLLARGGPETVFWFGVAGLVFGALCHLVNRLRAITPVPADHPVFTEAPYVLAGRAEAGAQASRGR